MKIKILILWVLLLVSTLEGVENELIDATLPADITFLIADLKYNQRDGVKICEIQHGTDSTFYGDRFSHGEPGIIPINFYHTLLQYQNEFWTTADSFSEVQICNILKSSPEWHVTKGVNSIKSDSHFMRQSVLPVEDPYNLQSYHGCVCLRGRQIQNIDKFIEKYPGIIFIDAASNSYWQDKYKMTELFSRNEILASFKPRWNLYEKIYSLDLAKKIISEIQSDQFVIKPRGAYLGNGVIIVNQEDLDETLKYILIKSSQLHIDPDKSYQYWYKDHFDTFIVEEFFSSDPIPVPHFDNQIFQPTMRVAFILAYNNRQIDLHFLGGYWILPYYPVSEAVSLNGKHKAYCKVPYFCQVDPETLLEVEEQLSIALPLLYREMLTDK
ncbi:MAG: hypothetical protein K940chlam3_00017 [Chlamydiae bacterium]|nr:hypothetical protein [Chlamydiota bacterium]